MPQPVTTKGVTGKAVVLAVFAFAMITVGYLVFSKETSDDTGLPSAYSGKGIRITILDASSGNPVEGAAVVVRWIMMEPKGSKGAVWYKDLHIAEALTDRLGQASIPEWGPINRPRGWQMAPGLDPKVIVFRPGYAPLFLAWSDGKGGSEQSVRPATPTEATLRLNTYQAEIASQSEHRASDSTTQRSHVSSPLEMLKLLSGQLESSVFGADNRESVIGAQWQSIVMADSELQRLSAPSKYRWSYPAVEERLAAQRESKHVTQP